VASACVTADRSGTGVERVRVVGSDTMAVLTLRWAESFMRAHSDIAVYAEGGGTGTGVASLIAGSTDICAASRPLRPEEVQALYQRHGTLGVRFLCAQDALSVYVNRDNPVRGLTLAQVKAIFTRRITDWSEVGGRPEPIRVVVRLPSSGTHLFFRDVVLDGEPYTPYALPLPNTEAVVAEVAEERTAIGYGGLAYGAGVRHIAIDGVEPVAANVRAGRYPLSRYLALYTTAPPHGAVKRFVDWALSPDGQRVVAEVGYVPLWPTGSLP